MENFTILLRNKHVNTYVTFQQSQGNPSRDNCKNLYRKLLYLLISKTKVKNKKEVEKTNNFWNNFTIGTGKTGPISVTVVNAKEEKNIPIFWSGPNFVFLVKSGNGQPDLGLDPKSL
jgi:hypothetical protein